jgi:putative DNA primase/helicase
MMNGPEWTDDEIPHEPTEDVPAPPPRKGPRALSEEDIRRLKEKILGGRSYEPEEEVLEVMRRGKKPKDGPAPILTSALNLQNIVDIDTRWADRIRLNEFSGRIWASLPYEASAREVEDTTPTELVIWLEQIYGLQFKKQMCQDAIAVAAKQSAFNPVRDKLEGFKWDGEPRVDGLLSKYFGAEDNVVTRAISRCFLVSCVARVMRPGCKVDTTLILVGGQGAGKSTALRVLALDDEWFADTEPDAGKDFYQAIAGKWLYELQEIDHFLRGREASRIKSLLSSQNDHYRGSYGVYAHGHPRQTVFVGSTNKENFLVDDTGNRRFWPILIHAIDLAALRADVEQLWGEAVSLYNAKEPWYLSRDLAIKQAEEAKEYMVTDPWDAPISRYLSGKSTVTTTDVLEYGLDIADRTRWTPQAESRVASVLRQAGWEQARPRAADGTRPRVWRRA